jgi:hypothetical protein
VGSLLPRSPALRKEREKERRTRWRYVKEWNSEIHTAMSRASSLLTIRLRCVRALRISRDLRASEMTIERTLRLMAGSFVLLSLLGYWVSPYWLLFTAFVGSIYFSRVSRTGVQR